MRHSRLGLILLTLILPSVQLIVLAVYFLFLASRFLFPPRLQLIIIIPFVIVFLRISGFLSLTLFSMMIILLLIFISFQSCLIILSGLKTSFPGLCSVGLPSLLSTVFDICLIAINPFLLFLSKLSAWFVFPFLTLILREFEMDDFFNGFFEYRRIFCGSFRAAWYWFSFHYFRNNNLKVLSYVH